MTTIRIPDNNTAERKYIIDILFNEFLGLDHRIEIGSEEYEIVLPNKKKLTIKDTFFNRYPHELDYLKRENIPQSIKELDIFAASFFMLTRWEEHVNPIRDVHGRFPAVESLAYKEGFLGRPVVNEWLEDLKKKLSKLDDGLVFKSREFQWILTHDIDRVYKSTSLTKIGREFAGDLLKRKRPFYALKALYENFTAYLNLAKDPFDTYDYLMDISEKAGTISYFFLHTSASAKYDIANDEASMRYAVRKIRQRGHSIGYHPSYDAFNDYTLFVRDKERIERIVGQKLTFGRQHYLRFEVPITWQIWEDAGMEWDSTMGYADQAGFRCGVCYPFSVFNILTRKKLALKERPLIVMDGSFVDYQQDVTPDKMETNIKDLIQKVRRHNGEFVFLWHNSSFGGDWKKFERIYEKVLLG